MNGATEATLLELLAVARQMNTNLESLVKKLGSGGSGIGASSIASSAQTASTSLLGVSSNAEKLGKAFFSLGSVIGGLASGAFSLLTSAISSLVSGIFETIGALASWAKDAMFGKAKLSGLFSAFEGLPIIGKVFSFFSFLIKQLEELLDTYRVLTKVGADFGGDLYEMKNQAGQAGMSLEDFVKVIQENSTLIANMGDSVQSGINKFVAANKILVSQAGILGLGYSAAEAARFMMSVAQGQGIISRNNAIDAAELAQKTKNYIYTLDSLVKITGMRADQIDAEVRKAQEEQGWQLFLDGLGTDQREYMENMIAVLAPMGPAVVEQAKNSLRGLDAPISDATSAFAVMTRGLSVTNGQMLRNALEQSNSVDEARMAAYRYALSLGQGSAGLIKDLGNVTYAANQGMSSTAQGVIQFYRKVNTAGGNLESYIRGIQDRQAQQAAGNAEQLASAEQGIIAFGNALWNVFSTLTGPIVKSLLDIGKWLVDMLNDPEKGLKGRLKPLLDWAESVSKWLGGWLSDLKDKLSADNANVTEVFQTKMIELFKGVLDLVIIPILRTMWNEVLKPFLMNLYADIYDSMPWAAKKFMPDPYKVSKKSSEYNQAEKEVLARHKLTQQDWHAGNYTLDDDSVLNIADEIEDRAEEIRRKNLQSPLPSINVHQYDSVAPQAKAVGGSFNPGVLLVGEKGPELLASGSSGNVITNENFTALMNNISGTSQLHSKMLSTLSSLTEQNAKLISAVESVANYTRQSNHAIKNLSKDAFA